MRIWSLVLGCLILAFGIWVLSGKATYRHTKTLVAVGSAAITTQEVKPIPRWAGYAGVAVGGVLVMVAALGRKRR